MKLPKRKGKPVRLETERFVLTTTGRFRAARSSYPWTKDSEVMHPMGYGTDWVLYKWVRTFARFDNRRRFCFAIQPKGTDDIIGYERMTIDGEANATLSIMIGERSWWGKGVVQETRKAVIDLAFDQLGCERVAGYVIENNYASIANYHMLGFRYDGINRKCRRNPYGQGRIDMIIFTMLADEWRARRTNDSQ